MSSIRGSGRIQLSGNAVAGMVSQGAIGPDIAVDIPRALDLTVQTFDVGVQVQAVPTTIQEVTNLGSYDSSVTASPPVPATTVL